MDENITKIVAEEGRAKAKMFEKYFDQNGSNNVHEMWKLKKKLFPKKAYVLPSAKLNYQGRVVTEPNELILTVKSVGAARVNKVLLDMPNQSYFCDPGWLSCDSELK